MPPHRRQSSSSNVTPSRQGSVETEREDSVTREEEKQTQKDTTIDAEVEDDEKEEVVVDMDTHMQAQMEKQKEDMKILLENFSPEQLQRYEAYRRSALNRTNVKRLVSQVLNQQCSQTMAFVVAGFAKVYVGEIIEKARDVMEEWNDTGPIRPEHLREAHRRYLKESSFANLGRKF
ncbi:TAFII28-domain-containing protein [Rhizopus microsporus var. microsporus]|uniref:Transcription initiation factor TFIID subunit 11 n=2 Tax=Rhizopus microsporus TaxID=58291 RepID=A0A2G4SIR6_RHIZD|nr:TAFII28-domain-containing protein [Rhizopus microsporus ATCC 52813]ORE02574.1 TAFII28-domain-containing protein [Rhizopus microsporus var. microsporus]PHZ08663.1 TAFII28-domain-containing protein [Rhizopus microsporus ATCC 52813]